MVSEHQAASTSPWDMGEERRARLTPPSGAIATLLASGPSGHRILGVVQLVTDASRIVSGKACCHAARFCHSIVKCLLACPSVPTSRQGDYMVKGGVPTTCRFFDVL